MALVRGRLKKLRQRFGIAAPRVSVRSEVAWYLRWAGLILVLAFSVVLAAWMYDAGRRFAGFDRSEVELELSNALRDLQSARSELDSARAGMTVRVLHASKRSDSSHFCPVVVDLLEYLVRPGDGQ